MVLYVRKLTSTRQRLLALCSRSRRIPEPRHTTTFRLLTTLMKDRQSKGISPLQTRPNHNGNPPRPSPDCLTPPNGATSVEVKPVLMRTMPLSIASATFQIRIVRVVSNAIDQGCGNAQKPKRVECEELSFLRPVFRLARAIQMLLQRLSSS